MITEFLFFEIFISVAFTDFGALLIVRFLASYRFKAHVPYSLQLFVTQKPLLHLMPLEICYTWQRKAKPLAFCSSGGNLCAWRPATDSDTLTIATVFAFHTAWIPAQSQSHILWDISISSLSTNTSSVCKSYVAS